MRVQRMVIPLSLALMGLSGCNPYERWSGDEFNAGPVDASSFPPQYLGTGANRQRAGTGSFTARRVYAGGAQSQYFLFSFSTTQRAAATTEPLKVPSSAVPTPSAYIFSEGCQVESGYVYDAARDDVDYSKQNTIFTRLPSTTYTPGAEPSWTYVPLVARVPVTPKGAPCQSIKSEKAVVARAGKEVEVPLSAPAPVTNIQVGTSDGSLHAFAIIEPGASVYSVGETAANTTTMGLGLQKWGWYNQYLLAYLDGGDAPVAGGNLVTQKLYYPRSAVTVGTANRTVTVGGGYDVVAFKRGEAGYSPVCEVLTYDAGGPKTAAELPKSATDIVSLYGASIQAPVRAVGAVTPAGDRYVYCLQLE